MSTAGRERRIAIIGSGFSGICLGIQLKKAGIESFTIFEKSDAVGGTWHQHSYPGLACDVKAHAYVFTGAGNPAGRWSGGSARSGPDGKAVV